MSRKEVKMSEGEALVCAFLLDGEGGGEALDWSSIDKWDSSQGMLWIHLDSKNPETQSWLLNKSNISPLTCESLLEQETRPRNISTGDGLLLILRGVNCNPGADPEDMVAIRMLVTENRIITIRYRRILAIQDIRENVTSGKGPRSAGEFIVMVSERIADRMGDVISDIDDKAGDLEDSVLTGESRELRTEIANLRRMTIGLRRYIAPQRDVLARLLHDRIPWINEVDRAHLREIAERTARFVEDIDSVRDRSAITHEELNNKLSEQMNKAMYTLSIIAAIFLPLGLITGLLGINVGGIPGTESMWAFAIVTATLFVLGIGLMIWFKKIKWL